MAVWAMAATLAGCAGPADDLPPLPPVAAGEYRLGPGDQVRLITFGEDQLSGTFRVDASGEVAVPLVGRLEAAGLTPGALGRAAADAMRAGRLLRDPSVAVEVEAYRPFFVLGEVARPGQYPYQPGMSVITAVAVAGGFTYRAVLEEMSVVRALPDGGTIEGRAGRQTAVAPGDVVTVFERRF